jgi:transposase
VYSLIFGVEDEWMVEAELGVGLADVPRRRRRSAEERRLIVEETLEIGTSVARVAQKYGINANQVFQWRRLYRDGHLGAPSQAGMKLLPVSVTDEPGGLQSERTEGVAPSSGAIHIELPGEVRISFEGSVDPATVRAVLQSLRG